MLDGEFVNANVNEICEKKKSENNLLISGIRISGWRRLESARNGWMLF